MSNYTRWVDTVGDPDLAAVAENEILFRYQHLPPFAEVVRMGVSEGSSTYWNWLIRQFALTNGRQPAV